MTESVWDYPRPPRLEPSSEHVVVTHGGVVVADSTSSLRMLETSHPPTYYVPIGAFAPGVLQPAEGASWCEWKGKADYFDLVVGDEVLPGIAWTYRVPTKGYEALVDHIALYPGRVDRCTVDDEVVEPQPGNFYGGWITSRVTGPFKGSPGTSGW